MKITYSCPLLSEGCQWDGDKTEILPHFEDNHMNSLVYTNILSIDTTTALNKYVLMQYLNRIYLIQIKTTFNEFSAKQLTVTLRLLGTYDEAAAFNYYIQVLCGTFSFTHINSNLITSSNGSIEVDLHSISLITKIKNLHISILFENIPKTNKSDVNNTDLFGENERLIMKENVKCEECFLETINESLKENNAPDEMENDFTDDDTQINCEEVFENSLDDTVKNESFRKNSLTLSRRNSKEEVLGNQFQSDTTSNFRRRNSKVRFSIAGNIYKRRSSTTDLDDDALQNIEKLDKSNSLLTSVKCIKCSSYTTPPIFICQNKHVLCFFCKAHVCWDCETELKRSKELEELTKYVLYPCRFAAVCNEYSLKRIELLPHEITCSYSNYKCPLCAFIGNYNDFYDHLKTYHYNIQIYEQLTNPFPHDATYIIANPRNGIFLCSSLRHNNIVDYKVIFCGEFRIYMECTLVFMSKREHRYLFGRENNMNVFKTSIATADLKSKQVKAKNALLIVNT